MTHLTYLEAAVVGLVQGVSELFPVSSLGHNVLIPALVGGSWASDLSVAKANSPYLAFIVGMHVATAIALLIYFWRDWIRIIGGLFSSIRHREVQTRDQRMAWMIILATIPVGLVGVVADKPFREIFGKPIVAGVFLIVNGVILYCGERFRPRSSIRADQEIAAQRAEALTPVHAGARRPSGPAAPGMARQARHASGQQAARQEELVLAIQADERLSRMGYLQALIIGASQIFALLAGISRDGITMVTGMSRGLSREDAARFAFLLATPVILAAGVLELPKLTGPEGHGIHGQILLGSILSGIGAYVSVRFLMRYFQTRTLTPFAIYCFVFGLLSVIYLGFIK
ncbi:MAG: undecaprenyl-diphosphate phosphatase [Streptosporangiaceae bacterium]|jgi:undecaprenyl-diphosphatase